MTRKLFLAVAIPLTLLSLTWLILTPILFPPTTAQAEISAVHPGFMAPDFTLKTEQGESRSLSDYQGQPVLVFLWASWCSVCKATMPGLQRVYDDYAPEGFEILAINLTEQDTLANALSYFQAQNYRYTLLFDDEGTVAQTYQVRALPTSVLVAPDGTVLDVVIGSGMSEGVLRAHLNQLISP